MESEPRRAKPCVVLNSEGYPTVNAGGYEGVGLKSLRVVKVILLVRRDELKKANRPDMEAWTIRGDK